MDTGELLQMPAADAAALLADEANWPPDVTGAVRNEWRKIAAAERLEWLRNVEETRRTMDKDAFLQWQGQGPTEPRRGSSIPAYYRGYWRARRRTRDGI